MTFKKETLSKMKSNANPLVCINFYTSTKWNLMPIDLFALIFIHIYEPLIILERDTIYAYNIALHHKYNWDSTFLKAAWQKDYIPTFGNR
jgi:hypothetical protein